MNPECPAQIRVPLETRTPSELGGVLLILAAAAVGGIGAGPLGGIACGLMVLSLQLANTGLTPSTNTSRFVTHRQLFRGPRYVAFDAFDRQSRRPCTLIVGHPGAGPDGPVLRSLEAGSYDRGATRDGATFWTLPG